MKHRNYYNTDLTTMDIDNLNIEDMNQTEGQDYPLRKMPSDVPAKRRKRRRRQGVFLPVFLCLIALGSLTGCLFLVIKNRLLEEEISEAAAYMEEAGNAVLYTEEEAADLVNAAVSDASRQKEEEILGRVKAMMENGEGTSAMPGT